MVNLLSLFGVKPTPSSPTKPKGVKPHPNGQVDGLLVGGFGKALPLLDKKGNQTTRR
jgi:hypothetical protein